MLFGKQTVIFAEPGHTQEMILWNRRVRLGIHHSDFSVVWVMVHRVVTSDQDA